MRDCCYEIVFELSALVQDQDVCSFICASELSSCSLNNDMMMVMMTMINSFAFIWKFDKINTLILYRLLKTKSP